MKAIIQGLVVLIAAGPPTPSQAAVVNGCNIGPAALCVELDLRSAQLRNANLARADFSQSDLSGADLGGANLVSADLDLTKLNRTNLARANLERADLTRAEMYGANLREARLNGANLHSADLNGAVLERAQLDGANLSGAHLPGTDLRRANLQNADLSGSVLSFADLRQADLTGANLSNAVLTGADLSGARMTGALFDGASRKACIGCPGGAPSAESSPLAEKVAQPGSSGTASAAAAGGCWARMYTEEGFRGDSIALLGPAEIATMNAARDWGFEWEPQYKSLSIGPRAVLTVYDNQAFRDRSATFKPAQRIPDLDKEMGIFRTIRSLRLSCVAR